MSRLIFWAFVLMAGYFLVAFVLILCGFLLQWPTILTVAMFPVLVMIYGYLARHEEADMLAQFGAEYAAYAAATSRFFPKLATARVVEQR